MIYKIENEFLSVAVSSHGAELQSIIYKDREYLWQGKSEYWGDRAPVLFPIVGRPKDGVIEVDGKTYPITIHGFAKHREFSLAEKSDSALTLELCADDETKKLYPFDFKFRVSYALCENKIINTFEVVNTDSRDIYFNLGAHPGFAVSENIGDWELIFDPSEKLRTLTCTKEVFIDRVNRADIPAKDGHVALSRKLFENDALIFDDLKCHKITLSCKTAPCGVTVEFDDFPEVGIWTRPTDGADYVCLEPWCGMGYTIGETSVLKEKRSIITLDPGEKCKKEMQITLF